MSDQVGRIIWCGNLASQVSEDDLRGVFVQAAAIDGVPIPRDGIGVGNFGFITYTRAADIPYALDLFQGVQLFGRVVILRPIGQITPFNAHLRLEHGNYVTTRAHSLRDNPGPPTFGGIPTERANLTVSTGGGPASPKVDYSQGPSVIISGADNDSSADNLISEQADHEQVHAIRASLDNGQMMSLAREQTSDDQSYLQPTSAFNIATHPIYVQPEWNYQSHSYGMHYSECTSSQNLTQEATTSAQCLWHYPEPTSTQTSGDMEMSFTRQTTDTHSYVHYSSPGSLEPRECFERPRSISSTTTYVIPETNPALNSENYQSWATEHTNSHNGEMDNPGPSNTQTSRNIELWFEQQNPDAHSYVHYSSSGSLEPRECFERPRSISSMTTYVIPETNPALNSEDYQSLASEHTNSQNGEMNNPGPSSTQTSRDIELWFEQQNPDAHSYVHNSSPGLQVPREFYIERPRSISSMTTICPENYQTWSTEHTSSQGGEINNPGSSNSQTYSHPRFGQFVQTHRRMLRDKKRDLRSRTNRRRRDKLRKLRKEKKRQQLDELRRESAFARRQARDENRALARPARPSSV